MKAKIYFFDCINFKVLILTAAIFFLLAAVPASATRALEIVSIPIEKVEEDIYRIEAEIPVLMDLNHKSIEKEYNNLFRDNILTFIEYTIEMALESERDFAEADFPRREFIGRVNYELKNSSEILSIKFDYYQYAGGAHGNPYSLSYNIDLALGEDLKLIDFLERKNMTLSEVENYIKSKIKEEADIYFQEDYGFQNLDENQCYYLENGQLVVYFQPYAIAPYSTGMPEFRIEY